MQSKDYKALILVGGYGTRLRPLTLTTPKPLVRFANKPILKHQIEAIAQCGVKDIILATNYKTEDIKKEVMKYQRELDINIIFSVENEILGTAGPLALAKKYFENVKGVIVFNSDVICSYPILEMMHHYENSSFDGIMLLTKVSNPEKYGVTEIDMVDGTIKKFWEKPDTYISNLINAGIYILSWDVLKKLQVKESYLEKDVFPQMCDNRKLGYFELNGFWMDIGQPADYLIGQNLYLKSRQDNFKDLVMIGDDVKIGEDSVIGPNVIIEDFCVIGKGVRIMNATIMRNTKIKDFAVIDNAIIGKDCILEKWSRINGICVLGDSTHIDEMINLEKCTILPFKRVKENIKDKIVM
ncbi:Mannose-1-phosphate guanyltransferase [Spraguea lophii 42_110]|uniref:mannose-1-phosphate guanylyltransferase n=1 Tax=Spraguea lophii (strain 42_110) TaxID=1358809 RepID=S7XVH7_SPRLO|nr:Mannose-1-phosphate guanyltransferase [Spraguea lophii 42_110]